MATYSPPLSVIFVWHPEDKIVVTPIVEHCFSQLSRDVNKPFSRSMNLPVFFRTTSKEGVPTKIDIISDKTLIFVFISKEFADDSWINYIKEIPRHDSITIIPIAIDKLALKFSDVFDNKNFIRAYEFEPVYINDYLFIAITHEVYRWALNKSFDKTAIGKDNAIKIFLSHAKDGKNGIKLAKDLKDFIDNSQMRNFFDAMDIAPSYKFDEEIIAHIKGSTIIAIHSDIYSSRYWCQREILCAKENNRPIIALDTLEEFEDRRFPFASNIPGVHVHINGETTVNDLLRILSSALLETVRFFYSELLLEEYKNEGWIEPNVKILSRPPEVSDIEKILFWDGDQIKCNYNQIVYPEPPLYSEELNFLYKLGIKINTPLTIDFYPLHGKNIGISISDPSDEELISIGQNSKHLLQLSQDVARHLLARSATLIYGGDLRPNGFTQFIFDEAQALKARIQESNINIKNYIAWPIYLKDDVDVKIWKAEYRAVAEMAELSYPEDVKDLIPSEGVFLPPTNSQNLFVWSRSLTEMRKKMIEDCDIRICAGGRHYGYKGKMPGVLEEIIIAIEMERPLFLLGGFGGVTTSVCKLIQTKEVPVELTLDWQIQNNPEYKELLDFCSSRDTQYSVNYDSIVEFIKNADLNNGLSLEDNYRLFSTPFIDEALNLIFKGLRALFGTK
ncbi:TIR domain-containing protein [Desulfitobacterium sp. AusDCA]|uniref:TIR domain-containing protein n=1 Tax=Desulfitobacterium sp. AusDCA TaxID=3240383 RepID=UPI003DA6FAA0